MTTVTPKIDFKQYCGFINKTPYAVASGKLSPTPHSLPFPHQLLALPADGPLPLFFLTGHPHHAEGLAVPPHVAV